MDLNGCDIRRKQNKQLRSVNCCLRCHHSKSAAEQAGETFDPKWVCCEVHHYENIYRPSARKASDLRT